MSSYKAQRASHNPSRYKKAGLYNSAFNRLSIEGEFCYESKSFDCRIIVTILANLKISRCDHKSNVRQVCITYFRELDKDVYLFLGIPNTNTCLIRSKFCITDCHLTRGKSDLQLNPNESRKWKRLEICVRIFFRSTAGIFNGKLENARKVLGQ